MSAVARIDHHTESATRLLTEAEVCQRLRCHRDTLRAQRERGLPVVRLGRLVRFDWDRIMQWLRERSEQQGD